MKKKMLEGKELERNIEEILSLAAVTFYYFSCFLFTSRTQFRLRVFNCSSFFVYSSSE